MTIAEAAKLKQVSRPALLYAIQSGKLLAQQVNGQWHIDSVSLDSYTPRNYRERLYQPITEKPPKPVVGPKTFEFRQQWWLQSLESTPKLRITGVGPSTVSRRFWYLYFRNTTHGVSRYRMVWNSPTPPDLNPSTPYTLKGLENDEFIRDAGWRWVHRLESITDESTGLVHLPQPV